LIPHIAIIDQIAREPSARKVSKKAELSRLSKDGKWKSFEKLLTCSNAYPAAFIMPELKLAASCFARVWRRKFGRMQN
jgi:hypothetical protein